VDVPVVPAAGLKGHVENAYLGGRQGGQIALADEIPGKSVVGCADGEHHLALVQRLAICGRLLRPDLLGHAEGCPGLGPACVEGRVGQNLRDLRPGHAVFLGGLQMIAEGGIRQPLGH